jgi:hypothetical protein
LINDDGEAFLAVGDYEQVVDQALVPLGKRHRDKTEGIPKKCEPTSRLTPRRLGKVQLPLAKNPRRGSALRAVW